MVKQASIELKNLVKEYNNPDGSGIFRAVDDINLSIPQGQFITLLGPSGCGKTTTLRMIAGFETASSGDILLDGTRINNVTPDKRDSAMVFQSYALFPHYNVFDNVAYGLVNKNISKEVIRKKVLEMLKLVGLEGMEMRSTNQLSGGQQQRVALARALVVEPAVLLFDEPLSNLDAKLRESMRFEIKELAKSLGITVIYVTHDQSEAMSMSDRILLFNNGEVQQSGTPQEIYNHPVNPFVADFLGKVSFFSGTAEEDRILLPDWGVRLPDPEPSRRGAVTVGIRPENVRLRPEAGELQGVIERAYYLGDTTDFRVRVGKAEVRAIMEGGAHARFAAGDRVGLEVQSLMVFDGENLQDQLQIRT